MPLGFYYRIILTCLFLSSCSTVLTAAPTSTPTIPLPTVTPTALPSSSNGFDPTLDGFSFKNYGFDARILNLLPDDVERLFGPNVCIGQQKNPCTLIPAAQVWMEEINRAMHTGHCEGMAVLSQYFYYGILNAGSFGSGETAKLSLIDNPALQREIAYWWATQATYPTRAHRTIVDARTVLSTLATTLKRNASINQLFTIGMYERDFSRGHTVTPIGMHYLDAEHAVIELYDNNVPQEVLEIWVNVRQNTWTYTAPNVDGTVVTYTGDATSKNLELTAAAPRMETQVCHFCPTNPKAVSVDELTTFFFSSSATDVPAPNKDDTPLSVYFVDEFQRRVGIVLGKVVNEVPGATMTFLRGAPTPWSPLGVPNITVPLGTAGSIHATGLADAPMNMSAFGPGAVVAVQNMTLSPDTESNLVLEQQTGQVVVASALATTPDIVVGYTTASQNVTVVAEAVPLAPDGKLALSVDPSSGTVAVYGTNPAPIALRVAQRDASGNVTETTSQRPATDARLAGQLKGVETQPAQNASGAAPTLAGTVEFQNTTTTVVTVATETPVSTATVAVTETLPATETATIAATETPSLFPTDTASPLPTEVPTERRPTRVPPTDTAAPTETRSAPKSTPSPVPPTDTTLPTDTAVATLTDTPSVPTLTTDPSALPTDTPLATDTVIPSESPTETRTRPPTKTRTIAAPTATSWWCDWNDWCLRP